MRRVNYRRRIYVCMVVFVAIFSFVVLRRLGGSEAEVEAADLTKFDPGYIMSDYQMSNYNSMTEAEIQSWLTSKNSCPNTDYNLYLRLSASTSVATWHFANGHFVCISEELFGDGEVIGTGETAAHIIWQAAQDYHINPQVLLVLLQKENSLITDDLPNSWNYRTATGYGCPDTAACSSKYYGFKNQIRNAAALFHEVLSGGWTNYPLGENWVRFSPHCDSGTVVNIRSLATSALYRYTPYQPNAAALAAGYTTVPGSSYETCAAYGNRNFYSFFEDWFGGITNDGVVYDNVDYTGTYNIVYSGEHDRAIVRGEGGDIRTDTYENTLSAQWQIKKIDDYYTITNVKTGEALDVAGGIFENKTKVGLYRLNNSCAQRWNFIRNDDGSVTIHNVCSPKYVLDLADGDVQLQIYKKTDYDNNHQKWILQPSGFVRIEDGIYNIYVANFDKVIGVDHNMIATGANVLADKFINLDNSRIWEIKRVEGENYYIIKNVVASKVLGVVRENLRNKSNIELCEVGDECTYYWYFEKNNDGYYIRNTYAITQALDLADGDKNVQVYTKIINNMHQKWFLRLIEGDLSGEYNILYAGNTAKVLSLDEFSEQNMTNVIIDWRGRSNDISRWKVEKVDDYYIIKNLASGKVLDVASGVYANRTNIWQYDLNKTCAQRWMFARNSDETLVIQNACYPKLVLDVHNGDSNVQIYTKTDYENVHQKWILDDALEIDYSGVYNIAYGGDNMKKIGVEQNITEARINVVASYVDNGTFDWQIKKENDYYIITNLATGKVLDLSGGVFSNKANIWQYNANGTCAQRWNLVGNSDGTVTIYSACFPQYVLDLADGSTNVQVYTKTSYENDHQKWKLQVAML